MHKGFLSNVPIYLEKINTLEVPGETVLIYIDKLFFISALLNCNSTKIR